MTAISLRTPARGRHRAPRGRIVASAAVRRAVSVGVTAVLALAVAAFLFLAVGPHLLAYRTSTMLTGSMSPGINPGDVVVSVPVPVRDLRVGDVVTYQIPIDDHRVETHRITELLTVDGAPAMRTKGDANAGADPWTARIDGGTMYRETTVVPHLGDIIRALRQPVVSGVLLYGATGLLIGFGLAAIWRKKPSDA